MKTLKIDINNHRKIFAIKEFFSGAFPNLKLEFYAKPHTDDGAHSDKIIRNSNGTISDCRTVDHSGTITISSEMTASELQDYFRDPYGLKAEVYKREGQDWVKTDGLEKASLEELNRQD